MFVLVVILCLAFAAYGQEDPTSGGDTGSVVFTQSNQSLHIVPGKAVDYVAFASFKNSINETGWSYLQITTNASYPDHLQAEAAGMIEGYLSSSIISMHYQNTYQNYCTSDPQFCKNLQKYLAANVQWIQDQRKTGEESSYWHQVSLVYDQLDGLSKGYALSKEAVKVDETGFMIGSSSGTTLFGIKNFHLQKCLSCDKSSAMIQYLTPLCTKLMNLFGDLEALEEVLGKKDLKKIKGSGSCSALVKIFDGNKDIVISHVTWNDYVNMLRVYKLYDFGLHHKDSSARAIAGKRQSFSSYPGVIFSGDDFYILSSGMVTQETTIGNSNPDLWKYVTPNSVLEWVRTIVANRLASNGNQWTSLFGRHNSGTYNNQWMVLDYKTFQPGKPLLPGTLWILEQVPGGIEMADMTAMLEYQRYWPSFNLPFFPYIYNLSGVTASKAKFGSWFDYELNPRSQIFQRDHAKVQDMQSLVKLMRYNDFQHDELSKCAKCKPPYSAENAISARSDLNPKNGTYTFSALGHRRHGGTDCKATNFKMSQSLSSYAVSGPTHDSQPVFQWSTSGWKRPIGHPDKWDFEPTPLQWV